LLRTILLCIMPIIICILKCALISRSFRSFLQESGKAGSGQIMSASAISFSVFSGRFTANAS